MKAHIHINHEDALSGYTNIELGSADNWDEALDTGVDDAEATEIIINNVLEFVALPGLAGFLEHIVRKLRHEGTLIITGVDAYLVAKDFLSYKLSIEEFNMFLHGKQNDAANVKKATLTTCCLGCIFAEGDMSMVDKKPRFQQDYLGCCLDILPKYRRQGEEIQDAIDKDQNEFHVVRGRVCPFHRTPNWPGWQSQDLDKAQKQARKEVQLKPDVVIYYDGKGDPRSILDTAHAINDFTGIKPQRLCIANNGEVRPSELMKVLESCPIPWHIETMVDPQCSLPRALDLATQKCTNMFITYFRAGFQPPLNFFDSIDQAIYDDLDKFICLTASDEDINGLTVLRIFHKQAGGNARSFIWEKAIKISKEQKCQYLVRPVTEIVTQLSQ
jgi:hypothetical protein